MTRSRTLFLLIGLTCLPTLGDAQQKFALVIGNSAYSHAAPLKNPVNDAIAVAHLLDSLGFEVNLARDLANDEFKNRVTALNDSITDGSIVFFFFAGHGIQVDQKNYLVPVDARLDKSTNVPFEAISVDLVLRSFESVNPGGLTVMVLDACRNNPFRSWERGGEAGLAAVSPPSGSIVGFSTSPGSVASDGTGTNGLYTSVLLQQLRVNQRIEDVFIQTRNEVERISGGRQSPWELSRLRGKYFLNPGGTRESAGLPDKIFTAPAGATGTEVSGVVKTGRPKDKKNVEVSVLQAGKLFDVVHTGESGKFNARLVTGIDPFDSIELRFAKAGLEELSEKVLPNSRGIVSVRMSRAVAKGRSAIQVRGSAGKEGDYYSGVFSAQYLYHTPAIRRRVAVGFSFSQLSSTSEYTYETLPGEFETTTSTDRFITSTIPARVYAMPYDHTGSFDAYIEYQIPLFSEMDRFFQASAGFALRLNSLLQGGLELSYFDYAYPGTITTFNPYGNATYATTVIKQHGFYPGVSLQLFLKKGKNR
jgi:hypothetical protein